jgi:UDPglucose--hexose-1-phosphate uridylyltransferase
MPELRKDYVLDRYVIIATERGKRPDQFKATTDTQGTANLAVEKAKCFFCPGNEHTTPPEIMRTGTKDKWLIRVFDNKFSAVALQGNYNIRTDNTFFTFADAVGKHEVIVETPNHDKTIADLNADECTSLIKVYSQRIEVLSKIPGVKYALLFKNQGKDAGTSIQHTHTQLIAYNLLPKAVEEEEIASEKFGSCPYCAIMNIEKSSYRRVFESSTMVSFTPYASRFPFEAWVFPKRHVLRLSELNETEIRELAEMMLKLLAKLKELNANYNFVVHYGIKNLHLHIEILPRLATWAGFELGSDTIINVMTPEKAAEFYRG